jgi:hypothetical protein
MRRRTLAQAAGGRPRNVDHEGAEMRRLMILVPLVIAVPLAATPANAHNAGCVQTGTGEWVFVGSGKGGPLVPEQNPMRNVEGPASDLGRLDLQPENRGDQYGARFAADQGNSAVEHPSNCTATR